MEAASERTHPNTALVENGRGAAVIIIPEGHNAYQTMAERVQGVIRTRTGIEIPVRSDADVMPDAYPVLHDNLQSTNLIILGRLGNNRAVWPVYSRFQCAVDGYYPGGDGYVLRTASNVFGRGANVIVVGGSSDTGVARAVEKLVELIETRPLADGALVMPWLLEVQLGERCKEVFDRDENVQMRRPFLEPGHDGKPTRRFYENLMSYYWSGRRSYLDLSMKYLDHVLSNLGSTGEVQENHYAIEFFVRAFDMIDDSGLLPRETIDKADKAIIDTFRHYSGGREAGYRQMFKGPLEMIQTSDHQNASWLADKVMADFILGKIPPTPEIAEVRLQATQRRNEYVRVLDYLVRERWRGCAPGAAHTNVATMTLFRYALEMEKYGELFETGNARRAALYHLSRVNAEGTDIGLYADMTSGSTEYLMFMSIVASFERDGELARLSRTMPATKNVHYGVHVNGVHTYVPSDEIVDKEPRSLMGAFSLPLVPDHHWRLRGDEHRPTTVAYDHAFDVATIRGGYQPEDDDLLLTGGYTLPANSIVRLRSRGQSWLSHTADAAYYNQNGLLIRSLGDASLREDPSPPLAHLDRIASTDNAALIRSTVPDYEGTDWAREVVWVRDGFYLIRDEVIARESGDYLVMANWRPTGGRLEGDRWLNEAGDTKFAMITAGDGIRLSESLDVDDVTRRSQKIFRQSSSATLSKGEPLEIVNLMVAGRSGTASGYELRRANGGGWLVRQRDSSRITYIGPMPASIGRSDAASLVLEAERVIAFDAKLLVIRGSTLIDGQQPVSRDLEVKDALLGSTLARMWDEGQPAAPEPIDRSEIAGDGEPLELAWCFSGAKRPGLIRSGDTGPFIRSITNVVARNTWDLGYVASLARISARAGKLPSEFEISTDGKHFEPFRGTLLDIDAPGMSNYGRTIKREAAYQSIVGDPQLARFVRAISGNDLPSDYLLFYDAARPESPEPLKVEVVDLHGGGEPDLVVSPNIWPGFRDEVHEHVEHTFYVLDSAGRERWAKTVDWRMLLLRPLDWKGTGGKQIFVSALDDNLYVYDADGNVTDTLTVKGTVQSDAPPPVVAGGHPLVSAVGVWQPDVSGRRKIVAPRYYRSSFFGRDGEVEGHARNRSGYWVTDVLAGGVDFTGDGVEDTVAMNSIALLPVTQESVDRHTDLVRLPASDPSLSGSRTLAFHLFDGRSPQLLVARRNMLGIYDLEEKSWCMTWLPKAPLAAVVAMPEQRQILAFSGEGVLWRIYLDERLDEKDVETIHPGTRIHRLAVVDSAAGIVVGASDAGLLSIDQDNVVSRIASGAFVDVTAYPSAASPQQVIAVDGAGDVNAYRWER